MEYRPLGKTNLRVSAVALGCWPIAGMTSPGVNDADSLATIRECFELGITAALCGAKRPDQIRENAAGAGWQLTPDQTVAIENALVERGTPVSTSPV